ncbi:MULTISPECIES: hypothetical protein [Acidocella]|nr:MULTISPECIES: hypothetical protein [Acidocella]EKM98535.1 hypothetical protein MXAZACID_15024 [Acidocella sp. MX-AZ02]WBO59090.1 hypothetical protein GT370_18815 [Acidocella sp. MX-AZ03]
MVKYRQLTHKLPDFGCLVIESEQIEKVIMTQHKFAIGQTVDFRPGPHEPNANRGLYTIRRQMPSETRDLQYRIQSNENGHERMVRESQLSDTGPQIFRTERAKVD